MGSPGEDGWQRPFLQQFFRIQYGVQIVFYFTQTIKQIGLFSKKVGGRGLNLVYPKPGHFFDRVHPDEKR
jgi:hypothetical protein